MPIGIQPVYTEGDWKAEVIQSIPNQVTTTIEITGGFNSEEQIVVAHVNTKGSRSPSSKEEFLANAALIAAAPELLDACYEALALYDNHPECFGSSGTFQVLTNAIQKATTKLKA